MENSACTCCGSAATARWMLVRDVSLVAFPVPAEVDGHDMLCDMRLRLCAQCGHLFQETVDEERLSRIYSQYYRYYPQGSCECMNDVYRQPFQEFFNGIVGCGRRPHGLLLEIGCSERRNLADFLASGFRCQGVDPYPLPGEELPGIEMVAAAYEDMTPGQAVEVFVSRFNLEHIPDLDRHVGKMAREIAPEGLVFVQVPNEVLLAMHQPNFSAHEHLHYFGTTSLDALFRRHGFAPAAFRDEGASILACFRFMGVPSASPLPSRQRDWIVHRQWVARLEEELREAVKLGERVGCYGCGMTLYWVFRTLGRDFASSAAIFDDNAAVHGLVVPGFGMSIGPALPDRLAACDWILLTLNPAYHDRVLARLEHLCPGKPVLAVGRDGIRQLRG